MPGQKAAEYMYVEHSAAKVLEESSSELLGENEVFQVSMAWRRIGQVCFQETGKTWGPQVPTPSN